MSNGAIYAVVQTIKWKIIKSITKNTRSKINIPVVHQQNREQYMVEEEMKNIAQTEEET